MYASICTFRSPIFSSFSSSDSSRMVLDVLISSDFPLCNFRTFHWGTSESSMPECACTFCLNNRHHGMIGVCMYVLWLKYYWTTHSLHLPPLFPRENLGLFAKPLELPNKRQKWVQPHSIRFKATIFYVIKQWVSP